ncbi:alpha-glucan water dikinase, chloroplastic isoform X2 [Sorghum bicolor]|uniref:alpha-glucan water dikinase, chloroplastic isoform X2 n=1 Tax=Sorghum bicolor TaxID=4558 RepID=UPI000B423CAA|nr:alpha-glucan water dikinase, chloroplastic isoform X2 [Sorghum bicolor]|eukprot:XP_021304642.1 alpha-glucan water dikinase, chloroplastic isoform X2 [Sorghum bicolor]
MTGFSAAASAAAAAERCALAIRARPAASSPAKRQQQSASLRRSGGQRRPTTLAASRRSPVVVPRAIATSADRASHDLVGKFTLDSNSELLVAVNPAPQGLVSVIGLEVTNTSGSLILHWGVLRPDKRDWILPSRQPDGTTVYKNRALRTPFVKSGDNSTLRIEIDDPAVQAIEFLIFGETQNKWFKNNGQNFQIQLQSSRHQGNGASGASSSATSTLVPEDLVQIQAYLRWERKGKQSYTPEQEKEEYEAARAELIEELNRGVSLEKLRAKLTKTPEAPESDERKSPASRMPVDKLPEDLVQVQAYIRWEKAGKPNYPPEKQLVELEEARKELQAEVDKGISIDQLRQKILKGNIESKVSKQLKNKKYFSVERIQRKKRDIMQLLSKHKHTVMEEKVEVAPKQPTVLDLFTKSLHEKDGCEVLSRKLFKFGDKEILAISTKVQNKTEVHLATNHTEPLILHWSLAKKAGEWKAPPSNILPSGSKLLDMACETEFTRSELDGLCYQVVEIELDDGGYKGMPFVLRSGETWIKNNGSDFFLDFSTRDTRNIKDNGDAGKGTAKALLERIADLEEDAQRSLMHRFNIAADLADEARDAGLLGIVGLFVWIRFMATRQLTWNKNYNVKPREISKAQDRFTDDLENMYRTYPQYREILRMIMAAVGRGGEGDVGQRIRDEILVIQRNNDCKGGMMEEWHQKLHNNTSPDDVVICQALIDYIKNDFDISVYWDTLNKNGITKERLLSYDRAIHSEPNFRSEQKEGLLRDLGNYMRSLKAVHSGADLESAIATCMGYKSEGEGFMVGVQINPVKGLPSGFPELLEFVLDHVEDKSAEPLLEGLLEARVDLRPLLLDSPERMKDLIFLDIALDSTFRTAIERSYEELNDAAPEKIMYFISLVLENLAFSIDDNEDILYCLKGWNQALEMAKQKDDQWALYAKAFLDRIRLALASKGEQYHNMMQPSAEYLGSLLSIDKWAVNIFTEEIIRGGSAATLSALLNRFDPVLRNVANLGSWQVISPVEVSGYVVVVDELLAVQNKSYDKPTILVAKSVKGEEEIPDGVVGVITPDMPDVLSHVSVRARNSKVLFATCFDHTTLSELEGYDQKLLSFKPTSADITYREITESELQQSSSPNAEVGHAVPSISLAKKKFLGKYAISAEEFTEEMVGAKSRNIAYLKGKVPSWVGVPTSVAIPFGTFEKVLSDGLNKEVAQTIEKLKIRLAQEDFSALGEIRKAVLNLTAPMQLVNELKERMLGSGMPWPGDEGNRRWEQAWMAIKKVWASKWNERAYFSTRKVKLNHEYLSMAVLVQEVVNADYAFVIHTTNPSSGDSSEIYAEVVKGLGETLVGAYPGRAMSFVCKKDDLDSPKLLGYPSKPIGLFIRRSIIFRSDSNGEDLEGYAGAGLYDSVPMDEEDEVVLDYTTDPLIVDRGFRNSILSSIARAGHAIEELYGSPQDVEGVVKDGKIYVVQTRPQM